MNNRNEKTIQEVKQDLVNGEAAHTKDVRNLEIALIRKLDENRLEDTRSRILDTLTHFPEAEHLEPVVLESLVRRMERRASNSAAASSTLAAVDNKNWWINLFAIGVAVVAVKIGYDYAVDSITNYRIKNKNLAAPDGNPFTDTSAAAPTHRGPRRLRPESSVSAVN